MRKRPLGADSLPIESDQEVDESSVLSQRMELPVEEPVAWELPDPASWLHDDFGDTLSVPEPGTGLLLAAGLLALGWRVRQRG